MNERRVQHDRRQVDRRAGGPKRLVAIEICHSDLKVAIVNSSSVQNASPIVTKSIPWRKETTHFHSQTTVEELTVALRKLAQAERLSQCNVRFLLNGELSVTRVVSGTNEQVKKELAQLEERCQRYLLLGPGEKAIAGCVRALDARHQQALLTVVNQKTIDILLEAARNVGFTVAGIEPSLATLAKVLPHVVENSDEPFLLVHRDEHAAEIGICHNGKLLLDYRPSGHLIEEDLSAFLATHMARLQRFCSRSHGLDSKPIRRIILSGDKKCVARDFSTFDSESQFDVQVLEMTSIQKEWTFGNEYPGSDMGPVIGAVMFGSSENSKGERPNLMEHVIDRSEASLRPFLSKAMFPIAAVLVLSSMIGLVNLQQQRSIRSSEAQLEALAMDVAKTRDMKLQRVQDSAKLKQLKYLDAKLKNPPWASIIASVGQSMPSDVWLNRMSIIGGKRIELVGSSNGESSIYELVHWLEQLPSMEKVAIAGTESGMVQNGRTTNFEIELSLKNLEAIDGYGGSDD